MEQVCNPFAQCRTDPSSELACLIKLKTKFTGNLELVIYKQLWNTIIIVARNIRIYNLSLLSTKHKMQLFFV